MPDSAGTDQPAGIPLRCPYCGGRIAVDMGWRGSGHMAREVVDGFDCDGPRCYASWDRDGNPTNIPASAARTCAFCDRPAADGSDYCCEECRLEGMCNSRPAETHFVGCREAKRRG